MKVENELYDYARDVAKNMKIDVNLEVILDEILVGHADGEILGFDGKYQIRVNPKYSNRAETMKRIVRHEMGHCYLFEKNLTVDKALRVLQSPFYLIANKFSSTSKTNYYLPHIVATGCVFSGAIISSTPLTLAGLAIIGPHTLRESLASYHGWKYK